MDGNQARIDETIWRGIGVKSVRQIADEVGLSVDEVLKRKNELRDEIDVLTLQEKQQKILLDLDEMSRKLREDYDASPYEFKSGLMNSSISALKAIQAEMDRMEKKSTDKVDALNRLRVMELYQLINEAVITSATHISEIYNLEKSEIMDIFQGNLREAAMKRELEA